MLRNYNLSPQHFASKWKVRDASDRHDRDVINQKAYEFATTSDPALREKLQLEVIEAFHGYLIKYFNLIVFGDLPSFDGDQGKEAQAFLRLLLPKSTNSSIGDMRRAAKHLHLAFKSCATSDEVYDVLVSVFLDVTARYDPHYIKKTEEVCKFIEQQPAKALITIADIGAAVAFDPLGCVRVLVRHNYIQSVSGPLKKVQGYRRGANWPPPKTFFESGRVGFTYFLTRWFRYHLQAYILSQMSQIEAKEHVLQLDHIEVSENTAEGIGGDGWTAGGLPHAEGNWIDRRGVRWQADLSMLNLWRQLDVSTITDDWVRSTDDFLFRTLEPRERYILQLVFVKDLNWTEIASALQCNTETARINFKTVMTFLENRAKTKPSVPVRKS